MSEYSDMIREVFGKNTNAVMESFSTPDSIIRYDDIPYGEDPVWQSLDVYRPKAAREEKIPVIINIHGGGWVFGDKNGSQFYCMSLAESGFAVVNFSYRLAPEAKFPSQLEDINTVMHWVMEHDREFGFDLKHIFCVGDSAGAHLLGLYANICTNHTYAERFAFQPPKDFVPAALGLNCGTYIIEMDEDSEEITRNLMLDFLPEQGTPEELDMINVAAHVTEGFPPSFIMTCAGDFLKPQAACLSKRLVELQVPHLVRYYGDKENPLGHVFHVNIADETARKCNAAQCAFFKEFC